MKIETKLNIGQEIYVLEDDKVVKGTVKCIDIHVDGQGENINTRIKYLLDLGNRHHIPWYIEKSEDEQIFKSKKELIDYIKSL